MVCLKWWGFVDPLTIYASRSRLKERFLLTFFLFTIPDYVHVLII